MTADQQKIAGYRTSAEIVALINAFENCTLPLSEWTREAYLTVAFWYLYLNSLPEAARLMGDAVRRYNFENNVAPEPGGDFQKTKMHFWLWAVSGCVEKYKAEKSFVALANLVLGRFADQNVLRKRFAREFSPAGAKRIGFDSKFVPQFRSQDEQTRIN